MTWLVFEPLETTVEQNQVIDRRLNVERVRLYLLKHNVSGGTLTLTIKRNATIVATSTINIDDISAATYFHGMVSFIFDNDLTINRGEVVFELSSSGYTYSNASYIGWVSEYENVTNQLDAEPTQVIAYPLTCQVWEYSERL